MGKDTATTIYSTRFKITIWKSKGGGSYEVDDVVLSGEIAHINKSAEHVRIPLVSEHETTFVVVAK